jgi:HprK-related kinase A
VTRIGELSSEDLKGRLQSPGIDLQTGPFTIHLKTKLASLAQPLQFLYADFEILQEAYFDDFHVQFVKPQGLRAWVRPQVLFRFQGKSLFNPFPVRLAFPMFEWGLNWCIATYAHQYLIVHSAVLERDGAALMLTAPPGTGKSTLAAALAHRGWRLLSDELALIRPEDARLVPLPRPIGLKNESIKVIRDFAPEAAIGPIWTDTHKGTVSHVRPPRQSVDLAGEIPQPAWIVFISFHAGAKAESQSLPKSRAFLRAAESAFNYSLLGSTGFETMARLIDACECHEISYGNLDDAVRYFSRL